MQGFIGKNTIITATQLEIKNVIDENYNELVYVRMNFMFAHGFK